MAIKTNVRKPTTRQRVAENMAEQRNQPRPLTGMPTEDSRAWWEQFQRLLDEQNEWPASYLFKFIAPKAVLEQVKATFGDHPVTVRASKKGNYLSVSARLEVASSDDVIAIYKTAGSIPGVISL